MDASRLFEEHHHALCRYLLRFTGDADLAADAAQEAFVRLLERSPRAESAPAWLFRVATNVARDTARMRSRRRRLLLGASGRVPHGDPAPAPDTALEENERREVIQQALMSLSAKERMALLMREEGFLQREIAEAVGTTTQSVGTLIARAMRKLADRIGPDREDL
jgi:RNA polymerase sigma factor (sigma-70 family)